MGGSEMSDSVIQIYGGSACTKAYVHDNGRKAICRLCHIDILDGQPICSVFIDRRTGSKLFHIECMRVSVRSWDMKEDNDVG